MTSLGSLMDYSLKSESLEEPITMQLYLPPNYSPLYTYPLIIAQDGPDYFSLGRLGTLLNTLINNEMCEKVVVCGIPYPDVKTRWHRDHPNGNQHFAFLRFLHKELVPALRKRFAIESLSSGVTLMGSSLGGTFSLLSALSYPYTFGNLILQSPYVDPSILNRVEKELPTTLKVYHSFGTQETQVETTMGEKRDFYKPNQELAKILKQKLGMAAFSSQHDGAHDWGSWQNDLTNAIQTLFAHPSLNKN